MPINYCIFALLMYIVQHTTNQVVVLCTRCPHIFALVLHNSLNEQHAIALAEVLSQKISTTQRAHAKLFCTQITTFFDKNDLTLYSGYESLIR